MNKTASIIIWAITFLFSVLLAHRIWAQYHIVPIVVGVQRVLSPRFGTTITRLNQTTNDMTLLSYEDGIPYDEALDNKITQDDLSRIRKTMAWSFWSPFKIELIVVHDASNVTVQVKNKSISALQFKKQDYHWNCDVIRGHIDRVSDRSREEGQF
jgi:hypothetical protein